MAVSDGRRYKPQQGDEAELFAAYNHELVRRVSWAVATSRENVEDATAFAWAQFLRYQPDRSRDWRAWLFRTAQRAAVGGDCVRHRQCA